MNTPENFVEVILPLSVPGTFTYHINQENYRKLIPGIRVVVSFGSGKLYTGIVHHLHQNKPEKYKTKAIQTILDEKPLVTETQIKLWEWIAEYYFCSLGDVYRNAFPNALRLESESFIQLIKSKSFNPNELSDKAFLIYEALQLKGLVSVKEAGSILDQQSAIPIIKELFDAGAIHLKEALKEKYKPKKQYILEVPHSLLLDNNKINQTLELLGKAPKQKETFLQLVAEQLKTKKPIKASEFVKKFGSNYNTLKSLENKDLINIKEKQFGRIANLLIETISFPTLTIPQKRALQSVQDQLTDKQTVLIHGITSSGKTEIYIHLIKAIIEQKQKVLFLLPEIGITTQLVQRLKKYFGNKVGVYHSRFNQNERVELWQKTLNNEYDILIGPRSALFLPFPSLGLIIVDEEHEPTFKQIDKKPYFHARDTALILARFFDAKTVLGSATPSLESYFNAQQNKYGFVSITERYGNTPLPEIALIDLKLALKNQRITGNISFQLKEAIEQEFNIGNQVIIFQNRRGFAPVLNCNSCGYTAECKNCSVSLTFHKYNHVLKCHYCGHKEFVPQKCPQCQSYQLNTKGIGTEQITAELQSLFPHHTIARMDQDSMRKKHAYEKTIEAFENQEIDLLVGTQMLVKGLDFSKVNLVGVVRADSLLTFPNFRATERAFQQLIQVAGRSGRRQTQGKVLLQTFSPENTVLQKVINYDYKQFMEDTLIERKQFNYPPFNKIILLEFRHKNKERVLKTSNQFVKLVQPFFDPKQVLGPEPNIVERIKNQYIINVMIKITNNQSPKRVKEIIQKQINILNTISAFRSVKLTIIVDPS